MEHLKLFENYLLDIDKINYNRVNSYFKKEKLYIGQMYTHSNYPVAFIGINNNRSYPITCLIIDDKYFVEWIESIQLKPMNISFVDYIIENNIVKESVDAFKNIVFTSGRDKNVIKKFYSDYIENNDMIKTFISANKFGL